MNDTIGVAATAIDRIKRIVPAYAPLTLGEIDVKLALAVAQRIDDPDLSQHLVDRGVEAWLVDLSGLPDLERDDLVALVKRGLRRDGDRVVVTVLPEKTAKVRLKRGDWAPFDPSLLGKFTSEDGAGTSEADASAPLTSPLADKLQKAISKTTEEENDMKEQLEEVQEERDRLRKELEEARREADLYQKTLQNVGECFASKHEPVQVITVSQCNDLVRRIVEYQQAVNADRLELARLKSLSEFKPVTGNMVAQQEAAPDLAQKQIESVMELAKKHGLKVILEF